MSDLKVPYSINEDAKNRANWVTQRTKLTDLQKEYVEFQLKESAIEALRQANDVETKDSGLHLQNVSNMLTAKEVFHILDKCETAVDAKLILLKAGY